MNQHIPWEKLARYFAGEMTGEELEVMKNWIESDPEIERNVDSLKQIWEESEQLPYQLNVDDAWSTLESKMDKSDKTSDTHFAETASERKESKKGITLHRFNKSVKKAGHTGQKIALVAASIMIILTAGYFSHHYYLELQDKENQVEVAMEELMTRDGQRAVYTLNDGSRVTLHAGSRLEVPANFNRESRELHLEGEAYFEVTPDAENPFIVHSGDSYTRVLGTKFLVQAWPGNNKLAEVFVTEGKVAFGGKQEAESSSLQEVIIEQNEMAVLSADTEPVVQSISDLSWHLGWIEGRLVFENRQISEILPRLERWYAVDIQTASPSIDEIRLTAEIDYSQPMMEVLTGIALSLDLEIERKDRTYTFYRAEN
jgi:transmembrane sensor